MKFWLEMGVDAFRLDAVPYLVEREGTNCENLPETHAILKELRRKLDENFSGRMLLAEANQWPADLRPYFGDGDEFHMAFHFPLMPRMFMGLKLEDRKPITEILQQTPEIPPSCQWSLFLRNHDELTLEMVTDMERDYMYDMYAESKTMRLNLGIRRRLAPLLDNDRRRIELMNGMLMSLPGTPIIYYGDEIGMGDNINLGDRNGVRTPMQWNGGWNGGFSTTAPERLYAPVIQDPVYGYPAVNVLRQKASGHSLLNWMQTHHRSSQIDPGVRQGIDRISVSSQPQNTGLRTATGKRGSAGGQQSFVHGASCRTRSAPLQGKYPDRDVWQEYISACGRRAVSANDGTLSILLVSASANLSVRGAIGENDSETRFRNACGGATNGDESWQRKAFLPMIFFVS